MKSPLRPLLAALVAIAAVPVIAATATATFSVTATINANCIVGASTVAFPAYDPTAGTNADATGTVTVTCTSGTPWSVGLDAGANPAATGFGTRAMASGGARLGYELYKDAGRTTVWTDTGAGLVTGSGSGIGQPNTVYGRVQASQTAAVPGAYTDSVVATVTF